MTVKTVMLEISHPQFTKKCKDLVSEYSEFIDAEKCDSMGFQFLYEDEPHVTLLHGLNPEVGENFLYHYLKLQNRNLYKVLKSDSMFKLTELNINTFQNDDSVVLKIDLSSCDKLEILKDYNEKLKEFPHDESQWEYTPHLTITYLKSSTPNEVIVKMIEMFREDFLPSFEVKGFLLSNSSEGKSRIQL